MAPMRYVLTPPQRAFKKALEDVLREEGKARIHGPDSTREAGLAALTARIAAGFPEAFANGLGSVESVVALEAIARTVPAASAGLDSQAAFMGVDPALGRAAVELGAAEGFLAGRFGRGSNPDTPAQALADLASAIEAARLVLYRAAVLEDSGTKDPRSAASVRALSEEIRSRTAAVLGGVPEGEKR